MALLSTIWDVLAAVANCLRHPECWLGALWRCGHVIWVLRVPVVSVVAGGYLLAGTVQARDLFADLGLNWLEWILFFLLLALWAWIVHVEGRRLLQHDYWVPESHAGPFSDDRRRALQKDYWYPAVWLPRLLGFSVFFVVGWAIVQTYLNLSPAAVGLLEASQALSLAGWLLIATIGVVLLYILLTWKPRHLDDWIVNGDPGKWSHKPPLLAGMDPGLKNLTDLVLAKLTDRTRSKPTVQEEFKPSVQTELVDRVLIGVRVVIIVLLLVTIGNPHFFATWLPRLFFIPVLFGGAVVLLGEVAAWSMRWRAPFLLAIVVIGTFLLYVTHNFHDVRWIEATVEPSKAAGSKAAGDKQQISFADAVERWKFANKCTVSQVSPCPRPILIAGAGGASRAGFFTATVVGALIDLGIDEKKGAPYGDVRSRIFALSTVSGSSAGAAVMRAALLDAAARNDPNTPPCKTAGTGSWFGLPLMTADKTFDPTKYWRDCFQAILAGDFLSPIFVALTFRDNFPLPNPLTCRLAWSDRAVLLEQALERRYHRFTTGDSVSCPDQLTTGSNGLCRPFGYHPDPKAAGAWVPIFFINGTSVFTGRRIVVGDVATTDRYRSDATLMPLAYDLNDVRKRKTKGQENKPAVERGTDIRLSTAATMSARFPVISPQGLLRTLYGDIADQIVDGGYFENDGLATITDLAHALKTGFGLDPVVIRIVNEPSQPEDAAVDKTRPPAPAAGQQSLFDDLFAVARTLVHSGSGHEDEYAASLKSSMLTQESRLYEIGVYEFAPPKSDAPPAQRPMSPENNPVCRREVKSGAKMEHISMSWWMSQPVQAYLDAQLCLPANWERLECELRQGRTIPAGECARTPPSKASIEYR